MDAEELELSADGVTAASLGKNSIARLGALLATVGFGFATSVFTARTLGPAAKGTLSTLSFLADIFFFYLCSLGLGEATIILVRKRAATLQEGLSSGWLPLTVAGLVGVGGLFIAAIPADWFGILPVLMLQGIALMFAIYGTFFLQILNIEERFTFTSGVLALRFGIVALMTLVLVVLLRFGLEGAVLASCVGYACAALLGARKLRATGLSLRPRFDPRVVAPAIRLGLPLLTAHLLLAMSQRADQVVVYSLAGPAEGGLYSVSLAMVQLSAYVPLVLSHVSFPRLASMSDTGAMELTARLSRVSLIGSLTVALVLAGLIPIVTPLVFGPGFKGAVTPALILLPGALLWSLQWVLARAWAARGRPSLVVRSFLVSVTLMLVGDLILIPIWGLVGAAIASIAGSAAGLAICVVAYHRRGEMDLVQLLPRRDDVRFLIDQVRDLTRSLRRDRSDPEERPF